MNYTQADANYCLKMAMTYTKNDKSKIPQNTEARAWYKIYLQITNHLNKRKATWHPKKPSFGGLFSLSFKTAFAAGKEGGNF